MSDRLTRRQAAIITAYTGITCGPFEVFHEYAEKLIGRPIWTHEFASKGLCAQIKEDAKDDFLDICYDPEGGAE